MNQRGFTLLEVVLAIAIFAMLSVLTWNVLSLATTAYERAKRTADNFDALQRTQYLLGNDLLQLVPRRQKKSGQIIRLEKEGLTFFTQTLDTAHPFSNAPQLTAVRWYLKDNILWRAIALTPDSDKFARPRPLLHNVTRFTARAKTHGELLPEVLEVTLTQQHASPIRRLYLLPHALKEPTQGEKKPHETD